MIKVYNIDRVWWVEGHFLGAENFQQKRGCSYPEAAPRCGLRLWYSTSSTVQTAPLTFSTRMKHLCRDKLWRTAFLINEK